MELLDEAERARLEQIVPELEKAVGAGVGGQALIGILDGLKGRLDILDNELGSLTDGRKDRKERAMAAEMVAVHYAMVSNLSAKAQTQFDGFMQDGFRNKRDLDTLSMFLGENSKDLSFNQRVEIVDEVLDGVERKDYEISDVPSNVMAEVQTVLKDPEINHAVTSRLSTEKAGALNAALRSDDPASLRTALADQEIFAATHEHVAAVRDRFETEKPGVEVATEPTEKVVANTAAEIDASEDFLDSLDPTSLPSKNSSQRQP